MNKLMKTEEAVIFALRDLYHRYGYSRFKMSKFEPYDLYMQNKEFLVSDEIITFTDTTGALMALKPDVTLSIVKNFRKENASLQKVCYNENVYRVTGASRTYREIMQTGVECLGDVGMYEICEVVCLAAKSLRQISDRIVLDISHMDIVSGILNDLQIGDYESMQILKYLAEKNMDAITGALGSERAEKLNALLNISGPIDQALPCLRQVCSNSAIDQLEAMALIMKNNGLSDAVHLDFSIISDRNYYNGFVFRGYVEGLPAAVLAGGQYDRLMDKMNKQAKGVGFAVYLDQLELLDSSTAHYDVDTVLLYDERTDLVTLTRTADSLCENSVFLSKELPQGLRYRRLMKISEGSLVTIENNG